MAPYVRVIHAPTAMYPTVQPRGPLKPLCGTTRLGTYPIRSKATGERTGGYERNSVASVSSVVDYTLVTCERCLALYPEELKAKILLTQLKNAML
jgi:hypothetical protein